jgi:membrane associated rhomboid family serine protease
LRLPRTVTVALVLATSVAWVLTAALGLNDRATLVMGVIPARLSGLFDIAPAVPAWLTPLTSTLVHGNFLHLALNMVMLGFCGSQVERVLGSAATLMLYVAGAFVAAYAQWATGPAEIVPMIGASGAISAVVGAFALSFGQQKRIVRSARLNRALNSLWLLAAWVLLQLLVGWAAGVRGQLLATAAHVGGFVAGLLLQRPLLLWRYRSA